MTIADIPVSGFASSIDVAGPSTVHPLGGRAKVLLCSVFGPYAVDDEYGSRSINPMELWHNQVTRVQGPFSLRMFHRSWGLMLIQANINARCTLLDFPTLDRFIDELKTTQYDIIGISAILPNMVKVRTVCELIRKHQPKARIVVGGHISNHPDISEYIDADHVVRGDGVRWFREFLGQDADEPIRHPQIWSGINPRAMGINLPSDPDSAAASLIPSVGCPVGCNFCSTSAMFGGKGKFVNFFPSPKELFAVMCQLESAMKIKCFFVMDENFLLHKTRAMELLDLMQKHDKAWGLYVFSSANALRMYTMEELAALGVSWVWLGLEGKNSSYGKLNDTDTHELVKRLQDHGIRVLGSSIVGLEEHTPENIDEAIAHAVSHDTDFHQFMLYTPVGGTPLYYEHRKRGTLLSLKEISFEDTHGQYRFNFRHPHIPAGQETDMLLRAFNEDFRVNGPSVLRAVRTVLKGYRRYHNHPDARIRRRYAWEAKGVSTTLAGAVWAAKRYYKNDPAMAARLNELLQDIYREFGLKARIVAPLVGRFVHRMLVNEARSLAAGKTYEPPTYYERNYEDASAATPAKLAQSVPGLAPQAAAKV